MIIDYEVVWIENDKMNFRQFSYEVENILINSNLPNDVYRFYIELKDKKFPVIVFAGDRAIGTRLLRYYGANPI